MPLDFETDKKENDAMSKSNPSITEALRAAICNSGLTGYRIAKGAGLTEPTLRRFAAGKAFLRLDKADRLAAFLGLQLVPDPEAVPPEPTPANRARPMLAKKAKRKRV